ncbi:hypothetical protein PF005_g18773 [Phytophthora fragariae]|uniref:Uncharacterized protein n=1 Tax=Phytophthora fragariae TaxID=53985 RepID=A0A6A3SR00_9STRA|nr:hypothetical protein PF009_g19694 [Phytophthora fragariae]KAE9122000.1 hypothetical protein PF006_g17756 [Phytophthora fragariae]KAE9191605.1 hypothetical protein PF005_g18773 [Phytophthora fragariae]KAE9205085.1 hypothetical protein PF004_g17661 [Phytophthora fragariae]
MSTCPGPRERLSKVTTVRPTLWVASAICVCFRTVMTSALCAELKLNDLPGWIYPSCSITSKYAV